MSPYTPTEDEYNSLAFGLDHHISTRTNKILLTLNLRFICKTLIAMQMNS